MNVGSYICLGTGTAAMSFGLVEPNLTYWISGVAVLMLGAVVEGVTDE